MKIGCLFDSRIIIGGGELSFLDLAEELHKLNANVVCLVPGSGEVTGCLDSCGIPYVNIRLSAIRSRTILRVVKDIFKLRSVIIRHGIEVLHANGARSMLYGGIAARLSRIPCVWHVRVLDRDGILDRLRGILARIIVANSHAVAQSIRSEARPTCAVRVVYNGFPIARIESTPPENLRNTLHLGSGPIVLGAGRFSSWKRFDLLIQTFAIAHKSIPGGSLVLAGRSLDHEAEHEVFLRNLAQQLCPDAIHFIGWRSDIYPVMKGADLLVLSSDNEPFGRVIIEAWACGLPVIVTSGGGASEIVEHGRTGCVTPKGEAAALTSAIILLANDPAFRERLISNARKELHRFSIEQHAKTMLNIYRELLAAPARRFLFR